MKKISIPYVSVKELLYFSIPIILGQLGQMLITAGDTLVAGHYNTKVLAAVGLSSTILTPIFMIGLGLHFGISPLLSNRLGSGKKINRTLFSSIVYSQIIAVIFIILALLSIKLVPLFGFDPKLTPLISKYMKLFSFSFIGSYGYQAVREYLQAKEDILFANLASIIAVVLNIASNFLLVFGLGPIPEMGITGLAISSIWIRMALFTAVLIYAKKDICYKIYWNYLKDVLKLSFPISITVSFEIFGFASGTVIAGKLGIIPVAAHNIALTLASITFMIPLAISIAASVKVGHAFGSKNIEKIKIWSKSAICIVTMTSLSTAILYWTIPNYLMTIFTKEKEVIDIGIKLLFWAGIFQLFDGFQVSLSGVLRGLKVTKEVSYMVFIAYWVVGIPLGAYIAFNTHYKTQGIWIGYSTGITVLSITLFLVLIHKIKK